MGSINIYQILSYGVIGLGFLLAFLAYRLLRREQQGTPRREFIRAIYSFMTFSVALCIIGFISEVIGNRSSNENPPSEEVKAQLIGAADLTLVSDSFFQDSHTKEQIIATIKDLVRQAEQLNTHKIHYAYKLFELELLIP